MSVQHFRYVDPINPSEADTESMFWIKDLAITTIGSTISPAKLNHLWQEDPYWTYQADIANSNQSFRIAAVTV